VRRTVPPSAGVRKRPSSLGGSSKVAATYLLPKRPTGALRNADSPVVGAEAAFRRADERGDADGAFKLGLLFEGRGDLVGAEAAFRRAEERGHSDALEKLSTVVTDQVAQS
jgi:TPR repeat protein